MFSSRSLINHEPRTPRPHQKEAIDAALKHFQKRGTDIRGTVVMACGSGKTDVGQRVSESIGERCLYTAPSLGLIEQAIRNGRENGVRGRYDEILVVCSDESVVKINDDRASISVQDLGANVTTDPQIVRKFLTRKRGLIFSTNQSVPVLGKAFAAGGLRPFDHITVDEAHVTTGLKDKLFSQVLNQSIIPSRTRLFLTATPKIFTSKSNQSTENIVYSMNDVSVYGERIYTLSFRDAIARNILSDYQLVVTVIRHSEARTWGLKTGAVLPEALGLLATLKAADEHGLTKAITFHSTVRRAKDAEQLLEEIKSNKALMEGMGIGWETEGWHIHGGMASSERKRILKAFSDAPDEVLSVVTNCKCLGVGIDVPKMDTIVIFDPKRDEVDLIQAVGRIMRKYKGKAHGTILVPVVVPDSMDTDSVVRSSEFKKVIDVVRALKSHDDRLALSIRNKFETGGSKASDSNNIGPEIFLPLSASKKLLEAIKIKVLQEAVRIAPEDMTREWLLAVVQDYRRINNSFPTIDCGELPGYPGMMFHAVNARLKAGHLPGYHSLKDFIDKEFSERSAKNFELTRKNLRTVIDTYRTANDGKFPSIHSGLVHQGTEVTFKLVNGRLATGHLPPYNSLSNFIDLEYAGARRKFIFSVNSLKTEIQQYRDENDGEFPSIHSGGLPNYPNTTFANISERLRISEDIPFAGLADFCKKQFKDHPDNLELTRRGLRAVVDEYRRKNDMKFPSAGSGKVPGFQINFSGINARLKTGIISGISSLGEFLDSEYPTERRKIEFELNVKSLREIVKAYRAINGGANPGVRSGDVPGYPGLNFTALNARIKNGSDVFGFSSLKDFLDRDP